MFFARGNKVVGSTSYYNTVDTTAKVTEEAIVGNTLNDAFEGFSATLTEKVVYSKEAGGSLVIPSGEFIEVNNRMPKVEFQPNDPYSIFIYFKLTEDTSARSGAIMSVMESAAPYAGWDFWLQNNGYFYHHLIANWDNDAAKVGFPFNPAAYVNQWVSVGVTYDGSVPTTASSCLTAFNFYVNGQKVPQGCKANHVADGFTSSNSSIPYPNKVRLRYASRWKEGGLPIADYPIQYANAQIFKTELTEEEAYYAFKKADAANSNATFTFNC